MNKTSLVMCLVLGSVWSVGCGDDGGSDEPLLPDASTDDTASDDDTATEDDTTDDDTATEDDTSGDDPATEDETAAEDEVATDDDEPTDEEVTSEDDDPATDDNEPSDEATNADDETAVESEAGTVDAGVDGGSVDPVEGGVTDTLDGGNDDATDEPTDDTDGSDAGLDASVDGGDVSEGVEIGPAGGSIESFGATLQIPAGSIDPPVLIQVEQVTASNTDGLVSLAWDFTPDGLEFDPAAQLTLPFDVGAAGDADVVIAWLDGDTWVPLTDCVTTDDAVTCPVSHFTTFGVVLAAGADGGTSTPTECPVPSCIADVSEACIMTDECRIEAAGQNTQICWENGVVFDTAVAIGASVTSTITWRDTAGGVCRIFETTTPIGTVPDAITTLWKNAQNQAIATQVVDTAAGTTTITCQGTNESVTYGTETCESQADPDSSTCTQGTCPF